METGEKPENYVDDEAAYEKAEKAYELIVKGFQNQDQKSDRIEEYWNIYNAEPDENLQYSGNSQGYVPAVRDCINARTKRTLKTLFPANNKHVDGLSSDGKPPYTQLALLEHYIRKARLKSIVRTDLVAGDVTGQWGLAVDWSTSKRTVTELVRRNPIVETIDGEDASELEIPDLGADDEEDTEEREVTEEGPDVVDFAVEDLTVIPPTCNNIQKAQISCLRLRYSREKFEQAVDEGTFVLPEGFSVEDFFQGKKFSMEKRNRDKEQAQDAGVKTEGTLKFCLIYMAYMKLPLDGKKHVSALVYYAGPSVILGILKNPLWSAKIPILSEPVERVKGSFFGRSKIEPVKFLQWNLCDFWNMGQDSAYYSLLPVWAVDPSKQPNWQSLVMGLAAVWPVGPNDVKPITQPQLWKDSGQVCDMIKRQIWESMDVNEMMMGRMPQGRKNNQLMGQFQQDQMTNITDHAERYEEAMLDPLVEMLFEFDQQFRTAEVTIESRGEIGAKAKLETIPVPQWGERIFFRWSGTAYQKNMQMIQQGIGFMNVLKGIPPQQLNGRRIDITPIIEAATEQIYGPELAPRIFIDDRNMFTIPPEMENEVMRNAMPVEVHEADNDQEHLKSHMEMARHPELASPEIQSAFQAHIRMHIMSMQAKREKQMAQQQGMGKGVPGGPGGAGPGVGGAPRPGAVPAGPRPVQAPPGAIQQDNMAGAPGRG